MIKLFKNIKIKIFLQTGVFLFLICFFNSSFSQTVGDFRSVVIGNYDDPATWERLNTDLVTWEISGVGENNPGQIPSATSNVTIQFGHTVTVNVPSDSKALDVAGTMDVGASSLNAGTNNISGTGSITISTGTIIGLDITVGNLTASNAATINCAGVWSVTSFTKSTSTVVFSGVSSINIATSFHNFTISGGTNSLGASINVSGVWSNSGTFTHNNFGVIFDGSTAQSIAGNNTFYDLTINNSSAAFKVDASGSTLKVDNNLLISDGIFKSASDYVNVQVDNGTTLELSGNITVSGNWTFFIGATFTHNNNKVTFDGAAQLITGTLATTFYDVDVDNGTNLTLNNIAAQVNNLTIVSGTLNLNGMVLTVKADLTNNGSIVSTTVNSAINMNGILTQVISGVGTYSTGVIGRLLNLTINNTAGVDLQQSIAIQTGLNLSAGNFGTTNGSTLTLGIGAASTLTVTRSNGLLTLVPVFNLVGVTAFNVTYNAAAGLITTGDEFYSTINTLIINNANGVNMNTPTTIVTQLTLTIGNLFLGTNDLTMGAAAVNSGAPFGVTKMVMLNNTGRLLKIFNGASAYTFPIGENTASTDYSPVTITFSANSSATRMIGISITDAVHPQYQSNGAQVDYITRYWTITDNTGGTYTYTAAFTYSTVAVSDVNGATANYKINRWDGVNWFQFPTTVAAPTLTATTSHNETTGLLNGAVFTARVNPTNTYTWNQVGTADFNTAANWTPNRTFPLDDDILQFNNGVAIIVTNVPTQTIGKLLISASTDVSLQSSAAAQTLTISGGAGTDLDIPLNSTLQLSSTAANRIGIAFSAITTGSVVGSLIINANTAFDNSFTTTNSVITVTGTITNNGGIINSTAANLSYGATGIYNHAMNGGIIPIATWNVTSNCNVTGITNLTPTTGAQTFGNFEWNCVAQTVSGSLSGATTFNGNFSILAGNMADGGFQITGNAGKLMTMSSGTSLRIGTPATARIFPTLYPNGNISLDPNSTIIYNSNVVQVISGVPTYGHLTLASTIAVVKTAAAPVNINGDLTINTNNTFADGGFTITAKGNVTNNGTYSGTGKLYMNSGSAVHTITGTGIYGNVELNDVQGVILSSAINIDGNFIITSGDWNNDNYNMTLAKDWTNTGGTFTPGTSIVSFDGITPQIIQNSQLFSNLNINNSTGVTINSDITVSSQLSFSTGLITTNANRVIVANTTTTAISGQSTTGYINGNLRQYVVNSTVYNLPVGDATEYEYASIDFTSIAGLSYIDIFFTNPHAEVPGVLTVNGNAIDAFLDYGYWTVTPDAGTGTYNISCQSMGHADQGGSADNYSLISNIGAGWASLGIHSLTTQYYVNPPPTVVARRSAISTGFGKYIIGHSAASFYTAPPITLELRNEGAKIRSSSGSNLYVVGGDINNNTSGTITVLGTGTIATEGNITNSNSSDFQIDGTLKLKGNWTNNAVQSLAFAGATQGTVEFYGTANQNIDGTVMTLFENLKINNTTGAGLGVSLARDQQVDNQLQFSNGVLLTDIYVLSVSNAATFSGYDNDKFVAVNNTGKLRKYIPAIGIYDLPIGFSTNSELTTIEFQDVTGISYIDILFISPHAEAVPGGLQVNSTDIDEFLDYGYWTIIPDAGTPTYNLTVTSKGHTNGGVATADWYSMITNTGAGWDDLYTHSNATQVVNGSYVTAKRTNLTNFGSYIIGKNNSGPIYNQPIITNELRNEGAKIKLAATSKIYVIGTNADLNNYTGGEITTNTGSILNIVRNLNNNASTITETDGTITVAGSVSNSNSGIFTQTNGTVTVTTNLTNDNSSFNQAAGTVTLTGNLTNDNSATFAAAAAVNITGNLTNSNSATLSLDGTLSIQGNWTNNATQSIANAGTPAVFSTVIFNGVANQTTAGSVSTIFEHITISNANGVTLSNVDQELSTDGVLTFTTGLITTGSNKIIINNTSTSAIVNYNIIDNSTHVFGNLRRYVTNSNYDFPVGTATNYELATVNVVSSSGLTYLDSHFEESDQNPPSAFLTVNGARVDEFLDKGYWVVSPNTGAVVSYDITVRETGHTDILPTADKYAILSNLGVGWVDYGFHSPATQIYDPTYVIAKRSTMSSFGYYLIGKTLDDAYTQPAITNELRNEGAQFKIPSTATVYVLGTSAAVNNYSGGTITTDGTLYSNGNVVNNGVGSFLKTDGTIQLIGNYTNDGEAALTDGDGTYGTVEFKGTSVQTINGSVVTQFEKLKINNAAGVNLDINTQVDQQLVLTSGILSTDGYKLINTNTLGGTNAVSIDVSLTSFVNGTIQQWVANSTSYLLPVGNASTYELATFDLLSSTGLDYIETYFTEDHTQTPPGGLTVNGQLVNEFLDYGFWTVSPKPGGSGTYNITVNAGGQSNGGGTPDIYAVISDIGSGWVNLGSHSNGTQSFSGSYVIAKRSTLTDFGNFIVGKTIGDSYTQPTITNELRNEGAIFKIPSTAMVYTLGTSAAINNYSGGLITVDGTLVSGTTTVAGSVTNTGGGSTISIDGTVTLSGNWTNTNSSVASLSDGDVNYGTVELNGTTSQTIGGTTITEFEKLKINNAAGATLSSNHKVTQQLILTLGLLNTSTNKIIISNTDGTGISYTAGTTWVNGNIQQETALSTYSIPLGTATYFELATLEVSSLGTLSSVDIFFTQDGTQTPPGGLTVGGQLVTEFLNFGYWTMTTTGSGTYNLTIQSGGHSNGGGTPDLYSVVTDLGLGGGWQDIGSHSSGTQGFNASYIYAKRSSLTTSSANFIIAKAIADAYTQPAITNELRNEGAKFKVGSAASVYVLGTSAAINNYTSGVITVDGTLISGITTVAGNITNNGVGSAIYIDGTVKLSGNWTNTNSGVASLSDGDGTYGTVEFNGTTAQTMGGTTVTQFEKLKINNSTASNAITISINEQINQELILTNGDISTGAFKIIVNNTSVSTISTYGENSYINGNIQQYVSTGSYPLPIGTTSFYELANCEVTTQGSLSYIDAFFTQDATQTPPASLTVGGLLVTEFLNYGYWNITPNDGTGSTYNVTIQSGGHSNGGGTTDLYSVVIDKGSGWENYGTHSTATQQFVLPSYVLAKRSVLSSYGKYIIGKAEEDSYAGSAITNELRNEGAKIKIPLGVSMYVLGTNAAINNYSSGVITNLGTLSSAGVVTNDGGASQIKLDGTLKLAGTWTNNGVASVANIVDGTFGTVEFNGTILQTVTGTVTTVFENFKISNAVGVSLGINEQIDNILTFQTSPGKLTTNGFKVIVTNTAIGAITGYTATQYIIGNLQHYVANTFTYPLPVGTSSYYELATMLVNPATVGLNYIDISFNPTDMNPTPGGLSVAGGGLGIIGEFLNAGYWIMSSNGGATVDYDLTIQSGGHYNGGGVPGDYAVVSRYNPPGTTWADEGGANVPADQSFNTTYVSAKRRNLTSMGDFIIGRGNDYIVYPPITNNLSNKGSIFRVVGANTVSVNGPTAQLLNNNSGNFIIETTATFNSDINISNLTSATILLEGTMNLKGTWTNNATASLSDGDGVYGTVVFNGTSAAQTITGSATTIFENLTISNSNGVTLGVDAQTNQVLTFTSGKLTTSTNKIIVNNNAVGAILTYDATKYIVGNLRRYVANNTYDLPIGDATNYELANIQINTNTGLTYIDVNFTVGAQAVTPVGLTVQGVLVSDFLDYGYWTITANGGMTAIGYNVTLQSLGHTNGGSTADRYAVVSRYNPPGTTWADNGIHSVSTQSIVGSYITAKRSNLLTTLGDFIIAKGVSQFYQQIAMTNELRNKGAVIRMSGANNASVNGTSAELNNSNSANFLVETTASFSSDANINNLTSSTILNEGTMSLQGIWTNNATASLSDGDATYGTVNFSGTLGQTITGSVVTIFENLTLNNASGLTLSTDAQTNQILTFSSGKLTTGANKIIVNNTAIGAIATYNSSKYIIGNLRRYVTNATSYDIPVGTATNYELANIYISTLNGLTYIDAKFTIGDQNPVAPAITVQGVSIAQYLNYGYWTLTGDASPTYNFTVTETGHTDLGGTSDMYSLISKIPTPGNYADNGIHSSSTQTYSAGSVLAKRASFTDFGDFVIGKAASSIYPSYTITNELHNKGSVIRMVNANNASVNGTSAVLNNSNSANFIVETTASFSSDANINNLTSSTLLVEGTLNLKGTWTNNATASLSDGDGTYGTVTFNSTTAAQTIAGSAITIFENLTINNANGVTLSLDAQVNQTLTFTSGKLTTGTNKVIVNNTATGAIATYNSSKYIIGNLRRYVTNTTYDLPVGTAANYELANISVTTLNGLTFIDAKFTIGDQNPVLPAINVQGVAIAQYLNYGYWTLAGDASPTYNLSVSETGHTDLGGTSDMYSLISKIPAPGNYDNNGTHSSTTQTYSASSVLAVRSALIGFGDFVIGKANTSIFPTFAVTNDLKNKGSIFRIVGANSVSVNGTSAQLNNDNAGKFIVETTAAFTSDGHINNLESSIPNASIILDGSINLKGNWTNNATSTTSDGDATYGTVTFNGTSASQTIAGSTSTIFENLILNNVNGLLLSDDAQINQILTFTSGKITTNTNKIIVTNTAAAAITTYNSSKYIIGNLRRYVTVNSYDLPIGTPTNYELATLTINAVTSGLNYIDIYFVEDNTQVPPGLGITVGTMLINQFLNYGYWYIASDGVPVGLSYDLTVSSGGHTNSGGIASDYSLITDLRAGGGWVSYGTHTNSTQTFSGSNLIAKRTNPTMSAFGNYIVGRAGDPAQPSITNMLRNKGSIIRIVGINNIALSGSSAELSNSNSGIVKIEDTGTLNIKGGILNNSSASIQVDGTLYVENYWTNNATSSLSLTGATLGTVVFSGSTSQVISGTSQTNFEKLTVNNTGTGISLSSLTSSIQVSDALTMTDGDINMSVGNIDLGTTGYVTGETANNRIKATDGIGTEGLGSGYITATRTINNVSGWDAPGLGLTVTTTANLGSTTIIRGHQKQLSASLFTNDYGIYRYYDFTPATNPSSAPVTLTMKYWEVEYNTLTENLLEIFMQHTGVWTQTLTTRNIVANTLTVTTSTFSKVTGATFKSGPPLPVNLISFAANYRDISKDVIVLWTTASEVNNDFFTVERSLDAINFEEVVFVNGAGNSNELINYSAFDGKPYPGLSYYRLKQTDFDGKFKYSEIVSVIVNTIPTEQIFNVFPNPSKNDVGVNVVLTGFDEEISAQLHIFNMLGKLIYTKTINPNTIGTNIISLCNLNLAAGMYYVILEYDNRKFTKKLIINQ